MYLPCESIGRHLIPIFRAHVSRELIEKYGFTQIEVAKKIGTTQAAISQYLRLKRGTGDLEQFEEILPIIQSTAKEIASKIASGEIDLNEVALKFCELCLSIQKKKALKS
ncbi:MAG: helix-turn-helix domain-containing protein [Candidatus Bathyarchaeia archaeon]